MTFLGPTIGRIEDVAAHHLCTGCGVCAYLEPDSITMTDVVADGRRPVVNNSGGDHRACMRACPGVGLAQSSEQDEAVHSELVDGWGPVLEVYEGHAADTEIRHRGSSGGAATALALHALQHEAMFGVLHTAARSDAPLLNQTVMSRDRADLLAATGSRYAPASPCEELGQIEQAPAPCVFIGKPCDVAATATARELRPGLDQNLGLTIAIFCAGTPSTRGTLEMVNRMGIDDPAQVTSVRYRGNGWPGRAEVRATVDGTDIVRTMTYEDSWGGLQAHCQWRCRVCIDHTGEFADVSVGDPWYKTDVPDDAPGRSLIVVRTPRGRQIVRAAIASGVLVAEPVSATLLPASQPNLLATRGAVAGRIAVSRTLGVAAPRYVNMPAGIIWWRELGPTQKLRSLTGTVKRIWRKRLHRRSPAPTVPDQQDEPAPVHAR